MSKKNKKVTLDGLGGIVGNLSTTVGNLSGKVDKLASAMEVGFKRVEGRMDKGFKEAKEDNESLARMVANGFENTAINITGLENGMVALEDGQEQIKLRLDNVAYHFDILEVKRRVSVLEKRVGIKR